MSEPIEAGTKVKYHTGAGDYDGKVINAAFPDSVDTMVGSKVTKDKHPQAGQQMTAPKYTDEYGNELGGETMALIEYVDTNGGRIRVSCVQGEYHGMFSLA